MTPLQFMSSLSRLSPERIVIIGGLPRSGTTTVDRYLHAHPSFFIADEHHGFINDHIIGCFLYMRDLASSEMNYSLDAAGRNWREFDRDDYARAHRLGVLSQLFLYTRPTKFTNKDPSAIRFIGLKVPTIEKEMPYLPLLFAPLPVYFIYCAREPISVLQSMWRMPWITETNPSAFANFVQNMYANSLAAVSKIEDNSLIVVRTGIDISSSDICYLDGVMGAILQEAGTSSNAALEYVRDEWPASTHRHLQEIPDDTIKEFSRSDTIQRFRHRFGFPDIVD